MKENRLPKVGMKIGIELLDSKINNDKELVSQVMDIIDNYSMFIAMPIYKNVVLPISIGETIQITYYKHNLGVYAFKAKVVGRKKASDIYYMKVERIGDIFRVQRRDFYRLEVILNAQIRVIEPDSDNEQMIPALTKDISGGGLRVLSKEALKVGSIVEITIQAEKQVFTVRGEVLRCVPYEESKYKFDIGIILKDIPEKVRESIISFIFDYQRKMRKKGLI
ncbi:flagellar brake protein [Crassaminicella indica]|uniref:PilZ domain-containing protein n=1 Tax=Crassaminicella indica TaxID=2855394 RepID=A0ABX8REH8_9CLOT|nr:PilZ domain-containing protein [Crassaminicella indica]QXM06130.1 PilZ domain-containing protein [Crassaminicella indica]